MDIDRVQSQAADTPRAKIAVRRALIFLALALTALAAAGPLASSASAFDLLVSSSENRSNATLLQGKSVSGNIYVFVAPEAGVTQVRFHLDDPQRARAPVSTDSRAPWDLLPGPNHKKPPRPYDTRQLSNGQHSLTAAIDKTGGGTDVVTATFTVSNAAPPPPPPPPADALLMSLFPDRSSPTPLAGATVGGAIYVFVQASSGITQVQFYLDDPQRAGAPFHTEGAAAWDFIGTNTDGTAMPYNTPSLSNGQHTITAAITRSTGTNVISGTFTADNASPPPPPPPPPSGKCPVPCSEVLVSLPRNLDWGSDHGGIKDKNGVGTGFTWLDKPTTGTGYLPANLAATGGRLNVTTTAGLAYQGSNSLDNALGVGIAAPNQRTLLKTTIVNPPAGTGAYQQAGLWFGNDQKNYVKLVVVSTPSGTQINYAMEVNDVATTEQSTSTLNLASSSVQLQLIADPTNRTIAAGYRIGTGALISVATFTAPGEFFSFDAAGIDPEIRTRSFGGVFASHRNGAGPLVYSFDDFSVAADTSTPPPPPGGGGAISFNRATFPVSSPTSMAWGPDNRLYVSELFGTIHAISFNASGGVAGDQVITTLGSRLTLGITVDPLSTASNVILWAAHSNPSTDNGQPNTGTVTKLSGAGFATRQDVITGLPRAIANHATNSIHFGPDGKLYLAQGGNTGAGAPNNANTEFGTMQEQPLSAALLVADVRSATFDGSCNNTSNIFGPPPCNVQTYSTGLRNTYDFVFHTNGSLYAPDNGLGVTGTYPPSPTPPCTGFGDPAPYTSGGDNPGSQPDNLNRLEQGKYYGHPNPYRNECVFRDGHYQNVSPPPNYVGPIHNLGDNRSANGTIEYTAGAFCGALKGDLLISNYSVGDDLTRVRLSADGRSVTSAASLVGSFTDPLPVAQNPAGKVFVGELGANRVTVLTPVDENTTAGCWKTKAPMASQVLDPGGAAVGGKLYVVAGKNATVPRKTVEVYNPVTNSWATAPDFPGTAVENPAVTAANGKLYVFGGSTAAFSGATTNAAVFDPATSAWASLPPLPTARGGAGAQAIGGKIYVVGGMVGDGSSVATVDVFDIAANSWTTAAPMGTRRDNPGTAALNGKVYVFGGRTRNADGSTVNGILSSVEAYDPTTNTWSAKAPMPTGRRTMVVGTLNARAQVMGGEITATNGTFPQNEEYDPVSDSWRTLKPMPTPRHGAAAGTINGVVYVAGGGPTGGTSLSNVNEAFSFDAVP